MRVKQPVSRSLARAFFSIIALSLLTSAIALFTLASSQRDAEAINPPVRCECRAIARDTIYSGAASTCCHIAKSGNKP